MPVFFRASDGTELAYHVRGKGAPLICVPGGPMRASAYLGDLGGLDRYRQLILLDLRGTGASATPADPSSYRCDRLVDDVLALQDHLDLEPDATARRAVIALRSAEPWYAPAAAAFERIADGQPSDEDWQAIAPFYYGCWDAAAQAYDAAQEQQVNEDAASAFGAPGAFDPDVTRAALAAFDAPTLVLGGDLDLQRPPGVSEDFAALFRYAQLVIQPGAGHFPWLDDADLFAATVNAFLDAR